MAVRLLSPEPVCMAVEATASPYFDLQVLSPEDGNDQLYSVEKLTAGTLIKIEGSISPKCSGFYINLRCGEDIALHINPRFDQSYIARNAKINRVWGHEESQLLQGIPFARGQNINLEILISPSEYLVSVNGFHLFKFSHRLSYSDVRSVQVSRDIIVSRFLLVQSNFYPMTNFEPLQLPIKMPMKCPVAAKMERLGIGDLIEVRAKVHALPHSFYLNLQTGFHSVPHPIISYHIVARYVGAWQVTLNSWSGGRWNEEISEKLPAVLLPGETFQLVITCLSGGYQTSIGGKQLKTLPYRVPVSSADVLLIQGDLTIFSVNSSNLPPATSIVLPSSEM